MILLIWFLCEKKFRELKRHLAKKELSVAASHKSVKTGIVRERKCENQSRPRLLTFEKDQLTRQTPAHLSERALELRSVVSASLLLDLRATWRAVRLLLYLSETKRAGHGV